MFTLRGSRWGPVALPDFLLAQLDAHGFSADDAGRCARLINEHHGGAAAASLFVDLGSCKFLEADIDGAIAAWRHAIASRHDAAAARAMLNLGLLHEHLHLHDQALRLLARVAERNVDPYVTSAAMASARCQVAMENTEQAMETMARLAQMTMARRPDGPELIEALYGLGEVAEYAGRLDRAERAWRVAAASPTSPMQQQAAARLIELMVRQGRSHAVVATTIGDGPDSAPAMTALLDSAELLLRTGEKTRASQMLATIDVAGFEAVDRFRFVDANLMAGRVNEAIDELEALLADDDPELQNRALFSLGRVYAAYDMVDPAISMLQRAVASDDPYWMPAASLALGDVLAARGDRGPAAEYWSYAAGGSVPRLAEMAHDRMAVADAPDDEAKSPATVILTREEVVATVEDEPEVAADPDVAAELAEPQLISLDAIDTDAGDSPDHGPSETHVATAMPAEVDETEISTVADHVAEPLVVVLDDLEPDPSADHEPGALATDEIQHNNGVLGDVAAPPVSAFAAYVDEAVPNPYAALAPDSESTDVAPTTRNPYAELAPNFAAADYEPPPDVEPGDWESMLENPPIENSQKPKKRPSAFSRYT